MSKRSACAMCPVRGAALCGALSTDALARLSRIALRRRYRAGSVIASEDQQQQWLGTVLSGVVKLTRTLSDGRRQIVGLQFASDLVGRPLNGHSSCDAEAASEVELCCVSRSTFEAVLDAEPEMKQRFLERTLAEVDAARDWMLLLGRKTAAERVATLLLMLARRLAPVECDSAQAVAFDLPLTRADMADYLGLRIETVSRNLRELEHVGAIGIANGRGIRVPDLSVLEHLSG